MFAAVCLAVSMSACTSLPKELPKLAGPSYADAMLAGEDAHVKGASAESLAQFELAARTDPARKQPWLRIAQVQFDARNYGPAITAAQEVLQRDNADVTAKSIMAASGLRVSAAALDQLREANALTGGTREEAQMLARTMRTALGESIFPAPEPALTEAPAKPVKPARSIARKAIQPADKSASQTAPVPEKPRAAEPKRNPFDALKG